MNAPFAPLPPLPAGRGGTFRNPPPFSVLDQWESEFSSLRGGVRGGESRLFTNSAKIPTLNPSPCPISLGLSPCIAGQEEGLFKYPPPFSVLDHWESKFSLLRGGVRGGERCVLTNLASIPTLNPSPCPISLGLSPSIAGQEEGL
jgi:hypothetical protein